MRSLKSNKPYKIVDEKLQQKSQFSRQSHKENINKVKALMDEMHKLEQNVRSK